jgi:hypothetical protein
MDQMKRELMATTAAPRELDSWDSCNDDGHRQ